MGFYKKCIIDIEEARNFAEYHHGGQKYDNKPYMFHLEGVVEKLYQLYGDGESMDNDLCEMVQAAYLHDVLEDTQVTFDHLLKFFSYNVVQTVDLLTRKEDTSYKDYLESIKESYPAQCIKTADILFNLEYSLKKEDFRRAKKYIQALWVIYGAG